MVPTNSSSVQSDAPVLRETGAAGRHSFRRISIIGATGSGKSYLALKLAKMTGIPIFHLDELRFDASGEKRNDEDFKAAVSEVIEQREWIIDGHYRIVRDSIWRRADKIVWMDYPIRFVLKRLLVRYFQKRKRRDGAAASLAFPPATQLPSQSPAQTKVTGLHRVKRFWRALKEKREYAVLMANPAYQGAKIVRLTHPDEADALVAAPGANPRKSRGIFESDKSGQARIIEMFGLPGSGKSTLARKLAAEFDGKTRKDLSREWANLTALRKTYFGFRGLADLRMVGAVLAFAIAVGSPSFSAKRRLARFVIKAHWIRSQKGTLLLDQGALQAIWSIIYGTETVSMRAAERLVAATYRGTNATIVFVHSTPETAANRIANRKGGRSRLDGLPESIACLQLQGMECSVRTILEAAAAEAITVIQVDAAANRKAVAQSAISELRILGI